MASFFGEVRPFLSRAVDDEEADNQPKYEVIFEKYNEFQRNVKLIIFSVGEIATIFVKSHFKKDKSNRICCIKYSCEKGDDESTLYTGMQSNKNIKDVIVVTVFTSSTDVLICEVSKSVPDEICYEITEIIFNNFLPSEVLILTSSHMATFKSESSISFEIPFLKSLSTSQYIAAHTPSIPRLDSPNFLSNMPASLLLKCEINKLPALCIINYVDTIVIDSINVHVFDEILKEVMISKLSVNHDAEARVIRDVAAYELIDSHLYI